MRNYNNEIKEIASFFKVDFFALKGKSKIRELSDVRFIIYKLLRDKKVKLKEIANYFNRKHSTISIGIKKVSTIPPIRENYEKFLKYKKYKEIINQEIPNYMNRTEIIKLINATKQKIEVVKGSPNSFTSDVYCKTTIDTLNNTLKLLYSSLKIINNQDILNAATSIKNITDDINIRNKAEIIINNLQKMNE